ncbi:TOTE conflict system archaeo-eukaryotic primase domain-containing protein [Allorhodopirellula heiligendammensis]|uniref:TOTE conflict system primase domain-containing protein n=1 Tax=Allorhodopirellula heiligendammensis TaxID=2714739 RepID=A0A5C6C2V7_9BACT|nr:hypothetical protein [Allorhodopirellula heiligendammensis]TWU18880.1 hypothetical protein Poly21_10490 [Allorhodopirellula heiligendammensis]
MTKQLSEVGLGTENAWQVNRQALAEWCWERMAVKRDRYGRYSSNGSARWSANSLSPESLHGHFNGTEIIGLGITSLDDECSFVVWDLDNHVSDESTSLNLNYAIMLRDKLRAIGLQSLIEDSDGKGGIHLWLVFSQRIPASTAHQLAKSIASDFREHGLEKIECFPKSPTVKNTQKRCGNYIRIPGKHHKRDHWSRFWGDDDWLTLSDSVQLLREHKGNDPALIPAATSVMKPKSTGKNLIKPGTPVEGDENIDLARQHAAKTAGAVAGESGHDRTFRLACDLIKGFSLTEAQALEIISEWNSKCAPPWTEDELKHKVDDAAKSDGRIGYLLRTSIAASLNEMEVNDQVVAVLAKRQDIFEHHGRLTVVGKKSTDGEETHRVLKPLVLASLREIISDSCSIFDPHAQGSSHRGSKGQRIPRWCSEAILARGHWEGIRPIRGVVRCPVLRENGTIVQTAGYDDESGLYLDIDDSFPEVPENPSPELIKQSVASLLDIVSDFPFANSESRSAWLASLLTPLAREAYRGCTGPMFLFDGNVPGTGKGLLAEINWMIVTGSRAVQNSIPSGNDEVRKLITSFVVEARQLVLFDDIVDSIGCGALNAVLTGTTWNDRRLGHNEVIEGPLRFTLYGTGNNINLAGDMPRRVCQIRLQSAEEHPEDRSEFQYPAVLEHVRLHRPQLLVAALTILRGYIVAGRPNQGLESWGSFEGWSALVRGSIVWCGLADPGLTRAEVRESSDSDTESLLHFIRALQGVDPKGKGLKAFDILEVANDRGACSPIYSKGLRGAIEEFCGMCIGRVSSSILGTRLRRFKCRVVKQMSLNTKKVNGDNRWWVEVASAPTLTVDHAVSETDLDQATLEVDVEAEEAWFERAYCDYLISLARDDQFLEAAMFEVDAEKDDEWIERAYERHLDQVGLAS